MKTPMNTIKWIIATMLIVWLGLSFILICGEENPDCQVSLAWFLAIKGLGVASIALWGRIFKHLAERGLLPDILTNNLDEV